MANNTVVLSRPIKSGCNFNACNPIIYKLRREDYQYNQVNNASGLAQVQINGVNLTAYFQVGNTIYFEGYGLAEITGVSFSAGNTLIVTDLVYVASGARYVNNLSKRTDYRVELEVFDFATNESLGPRISANPDNAGELKIDICGTVKPYLSPDWTLPAGENEVESGSSKKVYIKYQEFYDSAFGDLVNDVANPVIAVFAFINILLGSPPDFSRYQHGGNMLSFMPENEDRLWLTRFLTASMWRDWPFTLSFIWPDIASINRRVKQYNSENSELSDDSQVLSTDQDKVHRLTLGTISANAKRLIVSLEEGAGSSPEQIISELMIEVKDPCESQILLFWKNSLGGDAFWMFDETQDYQWTYPNGRKVRRMTLFADNLTIKEWDAINELNSVEEVIGLNIVDYGMDDSIDKTHFRNDNQVFIINQDGEKVGVIVIANDNKTRTMYKKHAIEITIELPEVFTV